jgi:hypothetical protein
MLPKMADCKLRGAGNFLPWIALTLIGLCGSPAAASGALPATGPAWVPTAEDTLHWDSTPSGGFRIDGDFGYIGAVRFTPAWPCTVKAVRFYQWQGAEDGRVYAWGPGTQHRPGSQLASKVYSGAGGMQWKRVEFDPAPVCPVATDFWVGVSTEYYNQEYPLGVDRGPMVLYRGGFIKVPSLGETWYQLAESPLYTDRNWNIRAIVTHGSGVEEELVPGGARRLPGPTFTRGAIELAPGQDGVLLDAGGRRVASLITGLNDVSSLGPGCYFLVEPGRPVRPIIILR